MFRASATTAEAKGTRSLNVFRPSSSIFDRSM